MLPSLTVQTASSIEDRVMDRLRNVVDPCMEAAGLGLSLVDLGIVRSVTTTADDVIVELGLTEPGCGFTHVLMTKVQDALSDFNDSHRVQVTFNWSVPWSEAMMTDAGRDRMHRARSRGIAVVQRFTSKTAARNGRE